MYQINEFLTRPKNIYPFHLKTYDDKLIWSRYHLASDLLEQRRMTRLPAILIIILTLLTNNIVLAGTALLDRHEWSADSSHAVTVDPASGSDPADHSDHADHCCHLQAHFQTVLSSPGLLFTHVDHERLIPQFDAYLYSHHYSPPTPPPKS